MKRLPADYPLKHYSEDFQLRDDGTLDTVIYFTPIERELRYSDTSEYRDTDGYLHLSSFLDDVVIPDLEADPDIWEE